jgi:acetyl-CoA C-acetyltransferase
MTDLKSEPPAIMSEIVIVSAARTPIGKLGGALSTLPAHQLGAVAIGEALRRARVEPGEVSEAVMGQVLTAGAGQNPARQAAVAAGIPFEAPAFGLNQVCGSGLRAVALAAQALQAGDAEIVVAGGQESMSQAPHCARLREGIKFGDAALTDTLIRDGLWDAFNGYHMGQTAENVAELWKISRSEQDAFAAGSQRKAAEAQTAGRFCGEIVPVRVPGRKGEVTVDRDEAVRPETTAETLGKLSAAFVNEGGTVTAGNASGLNDGAAALVLMRADLAARRGLEPLARIASWASTGVDPAIMGIGPVSATQRTLAKAGAELRGGTRAGLGCGTRECERRRDCAGTPDRGVGRAHFGDAFARIAAAWRAARVGHALHRWRHGHCDVRGTRLRHYGKTSPGQAGAGHRFHQRTRARNRGDAGASRVQRGAQRLWRRGRD